MAFIQQVQKIRIYDDPRFRSITWSQQDTGTGDDVGRFGPLITQSAVPGSLNGTTYARTDITGFPEEIRNVLGVCWTDAVHTAYEAHLRAQQ